MKSATIALCTAFALIGMGQADEPRKAPLTKYQNLWTNSPFTAKPPPTVDAPLFNPLQNYVLLGVSPIPNGYWVSIQDKKSPSEPAKIVTTNAPNEGISIVEIRFNKENPLGTVVEMKVGSQTGTVAFDQKFLVIKPPAAPMVKPPAANNPPKNPSVSTKRPRVLPTTNQSKQDNNSRANRRSR